MNECMVETINNYDLTKPEWTCLKAFLEVNAIEKHPAWKGNMSQQAIADFLAEQCSFTYILSPYRPNEYLLSYTRGRDHKMIHVHFKVIFDHKSGRYGYRNGTDIIFSSVNALIRYKTKGKGMLPKDALLRISA